MHRHAWAQSYMEIEGKYCAQCNAYINTSTCDVQNGTESIEMCEGYQEHLLHQPNTRFPAQSEELMEEQYRQYIEDQMNN